MQTRSQTRMEEGQAPMLRNSNVTSLPEPPVVARVSRNEERLQRRVEELEAQLRNSSQHSLQFVQSYVFRVSCFVKLFHFLFHSSFTTFWQQVFFLFS